MIEWIETFLQRHWLVVDDVGYLVVCEIGNKCDQEHWGDEFIDWYKPWQWLSSRRAATTFVAMKISQISHDPLPSASNRPR